MGKILATLTAPHPSLPKEIRRKAKILSALSLCIIPFFVIGVFTSIGTTRASLAVASGLMLVAYFVSRTHHYQIANIMTVLIFAFPCYVPIPENLALSQAGFTQSVIWLALPMLWAVAMLGVRQAIVLVWSFLGIFVLIVLLFKGKMSGIYLFPSAYWMSTLCILSTGILVLRQQDLALAESLGREKAEADARSQAKSTFLANMSHELRTPLNAVIGYSEMLQEEFEDSKEIQPNHIQDLAKIHNAGTHLLHLIGQILDLEKIESGKLSVALEPCEASGLIEQIRGFALPLMEKNNNRFLLEVEALPEILHTDPTKLKQILLNLLSNAAKFTSNGQCTMWIGPTKERAEMFTFVIEDNGIGMSQEEQDLVFSPFVQANQQTAQRYGGTGLGLAITQRLCKLMGGDIILESTKGQGSRFTVTLPVFARGAAQPTF